jgi:hypothetical protein
VTRRTALAGREISDLTGFLLGSWQLDREVRDASRHGLTGDFRGSATFTPDDPAPGLLRYVEHGTLRLGSHQGPASRRLTYHVDGPWARVAFDDGRYFHDLDLRSGVWEVEHPCGDDRYHGRFQVDGAHRWRQQWTVNGPHKRQFIRTVLERPAADPAVGRVGSTGSGLGGSTTPWGVGRGPRRGDDA